MKTPGTVVAVLVVVTASFFLLGGENTVVPARALAADVDVQYVRKAPAASPRPAREPERPKGDRDLVHWNCARRTIPVRPLVLTFGKTIDLRSQ